MLDFVSLAASESQIKNLGWKAATRTEITRLGGWGKPVSRCRTLREAIKVFCEMYSRQVSFVELGLSFDSDHAWLWRRRDLPSKDSAGELQGEQFMLGAMINVVRQAAGRRWTPPAIKLDSRSPQWLLDTPELRDYELSVNETVLAIGIPLYLLEQLLPRRISSEAGIENESKDRILPVNFVDSLHAALTSAHFQTPLSLELGAKIAETSPRTLRRWLSQEGTSWRDLINRIRFERAAQLLQHSPLTLAEVSKDLGYSDPAHFTRAFRRWTGEVPRDFRRRRTDEDSSPREIHH